MRRETRRRLLRGGLVAGGALATGGDAALARPAAAEAAGPIRLGRSRPGSLWEILGDGSDTTALWREAFAGIARAGGGAVRASGRHVVSGELTLPDVALLEIVGVGGCVLEKAEPGREFRIFSNEALRTPRPELSIRDIGFVGDWPAAPSMGGDGARCIGVTGYHRVVCRNLGIDGFRNMSLTAGNCDEVLVDGCRIRHSARDPVNLTGSRFVKVVNCTIQHSFDDAIAVHVPRDVGDETVRYATIIAGNQILQANGIKVLGGREVTIADNQILAPNNYGIFLGRDDFWREGGVPHRNVLVADNIVAEMIPHEYLSGQGNVGTGIFLLDPGGRAQSVRIQGNVVSKYKPSGRGVRFSDWGLGAHPGERRLFTSEGWTDPELVHGHQGKGIGIRIVAVNAEDSREIAVDGNSFANLAAEVVRRVRP